MTYYVYILKCADGTYYTGYTTDLKRRIEEHNSRDSNTKYTRGRQPVSLHYSEKYKTKSEALKREYEIKQMSRNEKAIL